MSLSRFEINIKRVEMIKPVFIVTSKSRMFHLEKPGRTLRKKLPAVKKISISHGSLFYTDENYNKKIEIDGLDSNVENFVPSGNNPLSYSKKFLIHR